MKTCACRERDGEEEGKSQQERDYHGHRDDHECRACWLWLIFNLATMGERRGTSIRRAILAAIRRRERNIVHLALPPQPPPRLPPKVPPKRRETASGNEGRIHPRRVVADAKTGRKPQQEDGQPVGCSCRRELHGSESNEADRCGVETREQRKHDGRQPIRNPGDPHRKPRHTRRAWKTPEQEREDPRRHAVCDDRDGEGELRAPRPGQGVT